MGALDNSSCEPPCPSSLTVDHVIENDTYTLSPVSQVRHGEDEVQSCDSLLEGYVGDILLSCTSGVLSASGSCEPSPCWTPGDDDEEGDENEDDEKGGGKVGDKNG